MSVQAHGPFEEYRFSVDGFKVPHITGTLIDGENTWNLTIDHRFGITVTDQELRQWLWFIANAMAVAAGYSAHGENSTEPNPYKVQVFKIDRSEDS